ncbi:hypothetical protein HYPDE_26793 [Hyphomicrobium denitrificans 1NES1]|uniref:Uncharacterized protein n=1 Tax=Hyphomicrobium denitrificans 1NES1 TaxID=670307 RepID=N0B0S3_9HYPH|nr:hypothetical protein [Hyphomicrobium denitrificans]AGK57039.1 hypothetical protein HYPDE_26793 [Hyphomicrobium denitrificans 1NES1]
MTSWKLWSPLILLALSTPSCAIAAPSKSVPPYDATYFPSYNNTYMPDTTANHSASDYNEVGGGLDTYTYVGGLDTYDWGSRISKRDKGAKFGGTDSSFGGTDSSFGGASRYFSGDRSYNLGPSDSSYEWKGLNYPSYGGGLEYAGTFTTRTAKSNSLVPKSACLWAALAALVLLWRLIPWKDVWTAARMAFPEALFEASELRAHNASRAAIAGVLIRGCLQTLVVAWEAATLKYRSLEQSRKRADQQ